MFRFVFREGRRMLLLRGCGAYCSQMQFYSWANARVHPEWVASSLQDPYWWQWLPHKVPTAHQEQFWGLVSCSRILRHVAQSCRRGAGDSNQQPSDHWSTSSTHWAIATELQPPQNWNDDQYYQSLKTSLKFSDYWHKIVSKVVPPSILWLLHITGTSPCHELA